MLAPLQELVIGELRIRVGRWKIRKRIHLGLNDRRRARSRSLTGETLGSHARNEIVKSHEANSTMRIKQTTVTRDLPGVRLTSGTVMRRSERRRPRWVVCPLRGSYKEARWERARFWENRSLFIDALKSLTERGNRRQIRQGTACL